MKLINGVPTMNLLAAVTYPSVERVAQYLSDIPPHPSLSTVLLHFPTTKSDILDQFSAHLKSLPRKAGGKIVAIIDGIVSVPRGFTPLEGDGSDLQG